MPKADKSDSAGGSDLLVSFAAGDIIFKQGDTGSEMFLVEDGKVELVYRYGPKEKSAGVLEAGDFFGEMSVLEDLPRNATAKAVEACRLLPVDRAAFDQMLRNHPELLLRMMRKIARRQRRYEEEMERANRVAAGVLADAAAPESPVSVESPAAGPSAPTAIRLVHEESGTVFPLDPEKKNLIGRHDPVTETVPEADLTPIDTKRTLSRRHARIWSEDGKVLLQEEMGAANGTFIDNKRLVPGQSDTLADGSKVRFGLVELVVQIEAKA